MLDILNGRWNNRRLYKNVYTYVQYENELFLDVDEFSIENCKDISNIE